jgi:RNA polymerase sigma factor (sigma-70 family)
MAVGQLNAVVQYLQGLARKSAFASLSDQDLLRRFIRNRDELAFERIVRRHGPLVLGVCRRVLRNDHDAEDAFQATFLVLVRKAAALRSPGSLANWLYGVANRTAMEIRRAGVRRRAKEALVMPRTQPVDKAPIDFRVAFDEELSLLPDKYREALLLCDLQAKTRREAALELSCAEGTVASRLARGRALLAQRLSRRGIGISVGAVAAAALNENAIAQVPLSLTMNTTKAAALLAAGHPISGIVSASIAAATEGALKSMFMIKLKMLASMLMVLTAGICSAGLLYQVAAAAYPAGDTPALAQAKDTEADQSTTVTGTVVDERGAPVAGVAIETRGRSHQSLKATSDREGKFLIALGDWPHYAPLVADDGSGRMGLLKVDQKDTPRSGLTIRLLPSKEVKTRVVDGRDQPIMGSKVVLVLADLSTSFAGVTAADGTVSLRYPREAEVGFVMALKSGAGFDYASTLVAKRERERKALPDQVKLRLTGSRTVRVKAVDSSERPVAGLMIYPWYIEKPGSMEDANIGGCDAVAARTDADGVAKFDWLPGDFTKGISFLSSSNEFSYVEIPVVRSETPVERLTMPVLRKVKLSGRVVLPDGRPAGNIGIAASGAGPAFHNFNGETRTLADGSYEMLVNSEEAYVIKVVDERWAAPGRIGVLAREDQPVANLDFTLAEGTILRGTVTVGPANRPNPEESILIHESGGQIPQEIRKPGDRTYHEVYFHRSQMTNARGEYRFCLGPGTYKLYSRSDAREAKTIVIKDQREIVEDFHSARAEWGMLNGKVIDQNGKPVAGAKIAGAYMRPVGWRNLESVSGADGSFKVRWVQVPTALFANTPDHKLAGIVRIDADEQDVTIRVGPTARAAGRLLSAAGEIAANGEVHSGIRIPSDSDKPDSAYSNRFGRSAQSDAAGRFVIEGLVPGEEYEFDLGHDEKSGRILHLATAKPVKAEIIELGDVRPPKIVHEKTLAEKTSEYFNKRGRLAERIAQAQAVAKRHYVRVAIVVGDPTDVRTQRFYELAHDPSNPKVLMYPLFEYEQVVVAANDKDSMDLLRREFGMGNRPITVPALAILGPDGKVLAARDSWLDERNPDLAPAALNEFLTSHALPQLDAEKLLAEARRKAEREGKRVFLCETGAYCHPCRLLARFLDDHKAVFDPNYVIVEIDRTRFAHGEEVMKRLRHGPDQSVPWCAILDDKEHILANWDSKDGNIGFPTESKFIEHFLKALEATAPRINSVQLDELRRSLNGKK